MFKVDSFFQICFESFIKGFGWRFSSFGEWLGSGSSGPRWFCTSFSMCLHQRLRIKGSPAWIDSVMAKRISCWTRMNLWRKEPHSWVLLRWAGLKTVFGLAVMIRTAIWLWWSTVKIPKASPHASSSTVCTNRRKSVALWGRRASATTFWSLFLKITSSKRFQVRGNRLTTMWRC